MLFSVQVSTLVSLRHLIKGLVTSCLNQPQRSIMELSPIKYLWSVTTCWGCHSKRNCHAPGESLLGVLPCKELLAITKLTKITPYQRWEMPTLKAVQREKKNLARFQRAHFTLCRFTLDNWYKLKLCERKKFCVPIVITTTTPSLHKSILRTHENATMSKIDTGCLFCWVP